MKTHLDWSAYKDAGMGDAYADIPRHGGDFAKAVAVCINSRQCETEGKGVMCPSYRVTGNPNLSTGGRVRLLKAALNSYLAEQALADPELAEAMDACVACKGCKRECENNVDMALIKSEYLAQRRAAEGPGLRARLFAHLPRWQHRYPWLASIASLRNRHPWLAKLAQRWLGITAAVPLPENAPASYRGRSGEVTGDQPADREVVLLVDTFTRYYEPDIAEAAVDVLNAAGYRVLPLNPSPDDGESDRPLCCGRTYLAQGVVEEARAEAKRLLDALMPHIRAGRTLVGLEPSCLLGLRDDHAALGFTDEVRELGRQALLFEEFLARESTAGRLDLKLDALSEEGATQVHGHCHQKAVGAMKSMRKVLKLIPDHKFEVIEAGCCGMAGTFGLEHEHSEMSSAMAEQALLPALRETAKGKDSPRVIANGFSCRQQIRSRGRFEARHLAQLLRDVLARA